MSKQTQIWKRFTARARVEDWERLKAWSALNGLSARQTVVLLISEFAESPKLLRLK